MSEVTIGQAVKLILHLKNDGKEGEALGLLHVVAKELKTRGLVEAYANVFLFWDEAFDILCAEYLTPEESATLRKRRFISREVVGAIKGSIFGGIICAVAYLLRMNNII